MRDRKRIRSEAGRVLSLFPVLLLLPGETCPSRKQTSTQGLKMNEK